MKKGLNYIAIALLSLGVSSCDTAKKETDSEAKSKTADSSMQVAQQPIRSILTAEEQLKMSPDEIIGRLKKGNENFTSNNLTQRDHSSQRRLAMIGQYPQAIVLSCVDSRVPVEDVFDLGIGDVFVARVAGNIENADIVGSMEFATAVAGSKVVIVMGHTSCGAVKHAIDNTDAASMDMNALQNLLDEIKPSMSGVMPDTGEISSGNTKYMNRVIYKNAAKTVEDIRTSSPKMASLEEEGKIKIVAAVYNMATGKVEFL